VELVPNTDFKVKGALVEIQTEEKTLTIPLRTNHVYKGTVKSNGKIVPNSWARIVVSDEENIELEGTVSTHSGLFHIKTIKQYKKAKRDVT
jgi:hypothetical protein